MKIFGFEYKTRRELIEENKKLKAENQATNDTSKNFIVYESCLPHKCHAEFIIPYGDESYLSTQKIKDYLNERLKREIIKDVVYEKGMDSLGRIVYSAEIQILKRKQ